VSWAIIWLLSRLMGREDTAHPRKWHCRTKHGRKRRYLARTKEELYPGSPHLAVNAYQLRPGWWCDTHASKAGIARRIRMACDVAGVRYGEDLIVNLG
jgi:hypothetical protein